MPVKRFCYILLCVLPLLVAACDRDEGVNGNYESTVFEPGYLEFGPEGGTAEMTVNGDLSSVSLISIDHKSTVEIFGEYRSIELKFNRDDQFPVTGDFGVCTVTATSPRNITVTVPPNSEYEMINFSAVAYEGRADKFMAPGGFKIWKVDDGE